MNSGEALHRLENAACSRWVCDWHPYYAAPNGTRIRRDRDTGCPVDEGREIDPQTE